MHDIPEILAPAGEWAHLHAAIEAGADAVYFGVDDLNMRMTARNFRREEMTDIARICHAAGLRCYLTLNVTVFERERPLVADLLDAVVAARVDAVIASDLAVISEAHNRGVVVHASTQMSISNAATLAALHEAWGIRTAVLARECTLDDVRAIRTGLSDLLGERGEDIALEAFAHGAMCVAVSGRCFMSQFQYGKSANRGECLQPCRREYRVTNEEEGQCFDLGAHYVMSPKDLCTLPFVEKLMAAGVGSLKIEGRNRSPEYVLIVTRAYRRVVDAVFAGVGGEELDTLKAAELERIKRVYNRGFSEGFYMGQPVDAWTRSTDTQATTRKVLCGSVTNYYAKIGIAELLVQNEPLELGQDVLVIGPTTGVVEQTVDSMQVDHDPVERVGRGALVAIRVDARVRRNDKVYLLLPQDRPT